MTQNPKMKKSSRIGATAFVFAVLVGATALATGNDYRLEQMRILRASQDYQSPPSLGEVSEIGQYERPPILAESKFFGVAALRGALVNSPEHSYTDLGRFHDLERLSSE